ncbi:MAG TPA: enoyl-CoA hydratase/isomerase family protein [Xanthobacteraceae bacterium]|nr:enoyl-CoA hydratase/isomerase family protein [Xanthobacteraceae bacterium]
MTSEPEILFERRGSAGVVTLNRPQALNAVTHGMVRSLRHCLETWAGDTAVTRIVIKASGQRAFSAGGDIRILHDLGRAGRQEEALPFWRDEYRLNAFIKGYPKPYVALVDGITMGGGLGLSIHGSHRVVGDRAVFAMPEVGIGFFPDVGGTFVLPRMPGEIGTYCALTADRLGIADAVETGIATHHVPSRRFPDLLEALCGSDAVDAVLAGFAVAPAQGPILARRTVIDHLFAGDRVEAILARLDQQARQAGPDSEWAEVTAAAINLKSPTSLKIALAQMRRGRAWSFAQCMKAEFRIVSRIVYSHDFYEGVRAVIIDKDNRPHWRPAALAEINDAEVDRYFAPLDAELELS